jgi:hypothetical protein
MGTLESAPFAGERLTAETASFPPLTLLSADFRNLITENLYIRDVPEELKVSP